MHLFESTMRTPFEYLNKRMQSLQQSNQIRHQQQPESFEDFQSDNNDDLSIGRVVTNIDDRLRGSRLSPFQRLAKSLVASQPIGEQDEVDSFDVIRSEVGRFDSDRMPEPEERIDLRARDYQHEDDYTLPEHVYHQFSSQESNSPQQAMHYLAEPASSDISDHDMVLRFDDGDIKHMEIGTQFDYKDEYTPDDKWNNFEIEYPFARGYPHHQSGYFGIEDDGISIWLLSIAVLLTIAVLMLIMCLSVQLINRGIRRHNQNKGLQKKMENYFLSGSQGSNSTDNLQKFSLVRSLSSSFVVPEKAKSVLLDENERTKSMKKGDEETNIENCPCQYHLEYLQKYES